MPIPTGLGQVTSHADSLPMLGQSSWAPRDRALDMTASSESPDPHPAGRRPPGSPRALLTRAGSHTAELSLQLRTLAGLAAVLGGHAGPHPAPGPPPAAAGAQAPGPPLLPHAVHCKEARGRWLGCTLAPPTAHPPTNQELQQFCDHSSLALSWATPFGRDVDDNQFTVQLTQDTQAGSL